MKFLIIAACLLCAQSALAYKVYYRAPVGTKSPPQQQSETQQQVQHPVAPAVHRVAAPSQQQSDEELVDDAPVESVPRAPTKSVAQQAVADEPEEVVRPVAPVAPRRPVYATKGVKRVQQGKTFLAPEPQVQQEEVQQVPQAPTKSVKQLPEPQQQQQDEAVVPQTPTKSVRQRPQPQQQEQDEVPEVHHVRQAPQPPTKSVKSVPTQVQQDEVPVAPVRERPVYATKSRPQNTKTVQVQAPATKTVQAPTKTVPVAPRKTVVYAPRPQTKSVPPPPPAQRPVFIYVSEIQDTKRPVVQQTAARKSPSQNGNRKVPAAPVDSVKQQVHHSDVYLE